MTSSEKTPEPPQTAVQFEFKYEYDDLYATSSPRDLKKLLMQYAMPLLFCILGFGGIYLYVRQQAPGQSVDLTIPILLVVAFAITVIVSVASRNLREKRHRKQWEESDTAQPVHVTITLEGVQWETPTIKLLEKWVGFVEFGELEDGFYLVRKSNKSQIVFPKRVIEENDRPVLRQILRSSIGEAEGFPVELTAPTATSEGPTSSVKNDLR